MLNTFTKSCSFVFPLITSLLSSPYFCHDVSSAVPAPFYNPDRWQSRNLSCDFLVASLDICVSVQMVIYVCIVTFCVCGLAIASYSCDWLRLRSTGHRIERTNDRVRDFESRKSIIYIYSKIAAEAQAGGDRSSLGVLGISKTEASKNKFRHLHWSVGHIELVQGSDLNRCETVLFPHVVVFPGRINRWCELHCVKCWGFAHRYSFASAHL